MAVIFTLSSQSTLPRGPDPLHEVVMRKLAHFGEFALLAALVARALGGPLLPGTAVRALGIAVAYAISDEIHQAFVPLRTPSPIDVLIDTAGALTALAILRLWARRKRG
jgi:VanZ family protein